MLSSAILPKTLDLETFIANYGDDEQYELIDGELIEMEPTGPHEQVSAFASRKLNAQIDRYDLPYFIPQRCLIRPMESISAFRPDLVVLDERELQHEPRWQREPVITLGTTVKLAIEVVSTNWQNDYARKYEDYETFGIPEFWIVDYLGIGGKYYIGSPKQPTLTLGHLIKGVYQKTLLRREDRIKSLIFPELDLRVDRLFRFG